LALPAYLALLGRLVFNLPLLPCLLPFPACLLKAASRGGRQAGKEQKQAGIGKGGEKKKISPPYL